MIGFGVLAASLMSGAVAHAADQPIYQPPPAWVIAVPIPFDMKPTGAATDSLLSTVQSRYSPGDDETFVEQAIRVNAPEGLAQVGNLIRVWDPHTQSLIIHRAQLIRGGKVIDLLAGGRKFTVLRRETNLEAATLSGQLTATLQPEGVQVGDVLDLAVTLTRNEPALAGHSEGGAVIAHAGVVGHLLVRSSWLSARPMKSWETDDLPALTTSRQGAWTEADLDLHDATTLDPPKGAPLEDQLRGILQLSDFKDWAQVSATAYPLYVKAAELGPASPLNAEVARIRAASSDPKARALAALELVESQVRYLYLGLDAGGYTPAPIDLTWSRRFADCKGKTVLLLALLKALGVQAEPALVSVQAGDGLDRRLAEMGAFDHVMVRATIKGRVYWLDGTRLGDGDLDVLTVPDFHWALPVRAAGATLEPLTPTPPDRPITEKLLHVDARAGIDKPAVVHSELVLRGDAGLTFSLLVKQLSAQDADRALRAAFTSTDTWIKPDKVAFSYDAKLAVAKATLDGTGVIPFTSAGAGADWSLDSSSLGSNPNLKRDSAYHRDAPYAVAYPFYERQTVEVDLPGRGAGFNIFNNTAINQTVGGQSYSRAAAITDGRMVMTASTRSLAQSFPAAQADQVQAALRDMYAYDMGLHYAPPEKAKAASGQAGARPPGVQPESPSQTASSANAPSGPQTPDGQAAARVKASPESRGEAAYVAQDYAAAVKAFTEALSEGSTAKLHYDRGAAQLALGAKGPARLDFEAALKLDPKDAFAMFALGKLDLAQGDAAQAAARFTDAEQAARSKPAIAVQIARAYDAAGQTALALPYWNKAFPFGTTVDEHARALNSRCWERALGGRELKPALDDCNESLRLRPGAAEVLDSRAMVELRLDEADKAVVDYDAALAQRPEAPTSLFGRGLAEEKLGRKATADADLAAARKLNPKIDAAFARWGLTP